MPHTLITIPISHYCEKARWALDLAGLDWEERAHLQVLHYLPALWAAGSTTVPVLIHDHGALSESQEILRWIDEQLPTDRSLYPAGHRKTIVALETSLGEGMGRDGRLWMYHHLLQQPELAPAYGATKTPGWQRASVSILFPAVARFIRRRFRIDSRSAADALSRTERVFDEIAERLSDARPYLFGDQFTAADLTFAALSAPVILPSQYGVPLPSPDELLPEAAAVVHRLRDHPAGRFALRMFAEERGNSGRQASRPRRR